MMFLPKSEKSDIDDPWSLPPKHDVGAAIGRLKSSSDPQKPRPAVVFTLQAPIMFLTMSVMTFLTGVCAAVYSPLAQHVAWDKDAKVNRLRNDISDDVGQLT